jgi:hypothetical protein
MKEERERENLKNKKKNSCSDEVHTTISNTHTQNNNKTQTYKHTQIDALISTKKHTFILMN